MPTNSPSGRNPGNGRIPFVWVQDDSTGHRYDVREDVITDGMTPVKDYEKNYTGFAREPKFATSKGGADSVADDKATVKPATGKAGS